MNGMGQFEQWVARARGERAPEPDVAAAVMRRLQYEQIRQEAVPALWAWAASAAACAAVVCGLLGYFAWAEMTAPWQGWVQHFANWGAL